MFTLYFSYLNYWKQFAFALSSGHVTFKRNKLKSFLYLQKEIQLLHCNGGGGIQTYLFILYFLKIPYSQNSNLNKNNKRLLMKHIARQPKSFQLRGIQVKFKNPSDRFVHNSNSWQKQILGKVLHWENLNTWTHGNSRNGFSPSPYGRSTTCNGMAMAECILPKMSWIPWLANIIWPGESLRSHSYREK